MFSKSLERKLISLSLVFTARLEMLIILHQSKQTIQNSSVLTFFFEKVFRQVFAEKSKKLLIF